MKAWCACHTVYPPLLKSALRASITIHHSATPFRLQYKIPFSANYLWFFFPDKIATLATKWEAKKAIGGMSPQWVTYYRYMTKVTHRFEKSPSCIYICGKASYVRAFLSRQTHCLARKAAKCLLQRQPQLVALIISARMQRRGGEPFLLLSPPPLMRSHFKQRRGVSNSPSYVRERGVCVCLYPFFARKGGWFFQTYCAVSF